MDLQVTNIKVFISLIVDQPRHPNFKQHLLRYESYKYWSLANKHRPVTLAQAGFYYSQISDRIICFSCSGGIRNMTENDDIWILHARFYGDCDHLKYWKDRNFITKAILKNSVKLPEEAREFELKKFDPDILQIPTLFLPEIIEREVNNRLMDQLQCPICMNNLCNAFYLNCGHQGCINFK